MNKIAKRLFLLSFAIAIIASAAIFLYLKSLDNNEEKIIKTTIIVASQNIPPRIVITQEMIKEIEISSDADYGNFIEDKSDIIGKYSKETILEDERFHKDKLIEDLNEELSLKISGNHRAVSVSVSGESGVSDLIKPGDFVDVIVYLPQLKDGEVIIRPDLSQMIIQNTEVLAVDKNLYRDSMERIEMPTTYLVTLSVPIFDVEKLVLAEDIGDLKLALRPLEGDYIHKTEGTLWQELILDDFYRMKDMFPQYEVRPVPSSKVDDENQEYDKYYYYTIQYGDTLQTISKNFYGTEDKYELIKQVNRIEDEDEIIAGTGIKIPILQD